MSGTHPYERKNHEKESLIGKYRVAMGLTLRELVKLSGVSIQEIANLDAGIYSPIYLTSYQHKTTGESHYAGEIKPQAQAIAEVLGVPVEDLFPRYVCKVKGEWEEATPDQVIDGSVSEYSRRSGDGNASVLASEWEETMPEALNLALASLRPRYEFVLRMRYGNGATLEGVARMVGVTRERARQIEVKALNRLKRPSVKRGLNGIRG